MRSLAKVTAPGAGPRTLGMPDWMLRNLGREARHWNDRSLASALEAAARPDHEVKGAGRDPQWSVQRMVMGIGRARRAPCARTLAAGPATRPGRHPPRTARSPARITAHRAPRSPRQPGKAAGRLPRVT